MENTNKMKNLANDLKDKASLIDFLIGHMPNPEQQPEDVRRVQYDQYLSLLKHWK